ncbi:hypothetical protein I5Q34_15020 [Streptomyces sp. AV19]|uniref:hypothetical protein n=1 Tax=Streptomyces sp. AV19 TaxID=2793068 RepID=UPI0018FEF215|nr:hypothetical protein [Streptomyces sp. AV19]MBH1935566.1 hypothetical protein [Streptomyces sp. AV19]MDG4534453.1 hypothetical protein [Streptomyces sp. AV19]
MNGGWAGLRAVAALGALTVTAGAHPARAAEGARTPAAYRTAPGAQAVRGAPEDADGPLLEAGGRTYTDRLAPGERKSYRVRLDAASDAYVSAVAAPRPGSAMGLRDGIDVSLRAADGTPCGPARHRSFLAEGGAYPLADHTERLAGTGGACGAAGTYRFVVARGDADGGDAAPLPLELKHTAARPATGSPVSDSGPGSWSSQAPSGPAGPGRDVTGGSGFNDAVRVGAGTWRDRIRPGETRFYRVTVPAGQQLFAKAAFGSASGPYVANGVRLGLSDAARGHVMNRTEGYGGSAAAVALATPPAAGPGALRGGEAERGMGRAGGYFLQVSLNAKAAGGRSDPVPVRLAVGLAPARKDPAADGLPRILGGRPAAARAGAADGGWLRAAGYAGVGTGTALLLGLGGWVLLARRAGGGR